MAAFAHEDVRMVASGRMSANGTGIFGPTHGSAPEIAGQGVANPMAMLLAASVMLGEGLGERAAAETLERAVAEALGDGVRTADLVVPALPPRPASSWTSSSPACRRPGGTRSSPRA